MNTPNLRRHLWLLVLSIGLVSVIAYISQPTSLGGLASVVWLVVAPVAILTGIAIHKPDGSSPWRLVGLGHIALAVVVITLIADVADNAAPPSPNLYDATILGSSVVVIAGYFWIAAIRTTGARLVSILDGLVVGISVFALLWLEVLHLIAHDGHAPPSAAGLVASAYAVLGAISVGVIAVLLIGAHRPGTALWLMLASAVGVLYSNIILARELIEGTYAGAGAWGAGWVVGSILLASASLHPSMTRVAVRPGPDASDVSGRAVAALCATAVAVGLVAVLHGDEFDLSTRIVVIGALALMITVIVVRLWLALRSLAVTLRSRQALEEELRAQAVRDPLTGLANRTLLARHIAEALRRDPTGTALVYIDLDDFKLVNDTLGHVIGDAVLEAAGRRIAHSIRSGDLAARVGGDEFAVLLTQLADPTEAADIAERLLTAFETPLAVAGREVELHLSIGVALGRVGLDDTDLVREADIAMYVAKNEGKARVKVFEGALHADVFNRLALRADLEKAVERDEFRLDYQPIVDLAEGEPLVLEALIRWHHPVRGPIPPADFIPLAEATGIIRSIGRWVLGEACRQLSEWNKSGTARKISVSVNVSPLQLKDRGIVEDVRAALAESGVEGERLIVEMTESVVLEGEEAVATLVELKGLGVQIAIDDFGTGYSSLAYLTRLPIDYLKVDRSFVQALATGRRERDLLQTVLRIANAMHVKTVAEGIELEQQVIDLRKLGCRIGQGYHYARPMPPDQIEAWLSKAALTRRRDDRRRRLAPSVPPATSAPSIGD